MESPLQVILAGMNVDIEGLNEIKQILSEENLAGILTSARREEALILLSKLTPETIAASYARISRDARPIPELRKVAREEVENARKINQNVIFTMGHKSIAEHAFFNFDIMGLSRRAVEELEKKRLQSYTEKSQRYITLKGDFVIPPEIECTPLESEFVELIEKQNKFYHDNLDRLIAWHIKQNPELASNPKKKDTLEGYGKEDARYALAMATQAQIGVSLTARNLERLVTELRSSESREVRVLGERLLKEVEGIAPSVIKYTSSTDYYARTRKELREYVSELIKETKVKPETLKNFQIHDSISSKSINLFTNLKRDDSISAGIIFSSSNLPFNSCLELIHFLKREEKTELLKKADAYQEVHDPKLREYELGDRIAEIKLSSSAFAQLKRHRINTLIPQEYDISLNPTIPDSIVKTSLQGDLIKITNKSSRFYKKMLAEGLPKIVAEYALTNAHKRRVLLDANNRQMHAICAERENMAAQWDIRNLANELHDLVQKESPLTTAYLCGKDKFYEVKKKDILEMQKGYYIILEGGEGCGKDTQAKLLREYFESKGLPCILTKEPGGTPYAEEIGKKLKNEQMNPVRELVLFEEARKDNYNEIIVPSIQEGKNVIKTRGWPSTFAYQGFGGGIDLKLIRELNKTATQEYLPDLLIILDIVPKKGLEKEVAPDRFAAKGIEYHERVREGYLWVAKKYHNISVLIPYMEGIEKMHGIIKDVVHKRLNL